LAQNVSVFNFCYREGTIMGHFHHTEGKLWLALRALTGPESQRKRLQAAYLDHLSELQDAEVPASQQARFAKLRDALTHERQLHPEITIAGMTDAEVADLVDEIVHVCGAVMESAAMAAAAMGSPDMMPDSAGSAGH
jgi:hypothetical protein